MVKVLFGGPYHIILYLVKMKGGSTYHGSHLNTCMHIHTHTYRAQLIYGHLYYKPLVWPPLFDRKKFYGQLSSVSHAACMWGGPSWEVKRRNDVSACIQNKIFFLFFLRGKIRSYTTMLQWYIFYEKKTF